MDITEITSSKGGIVVLLREPLNARQFVEEIAQKASFLLEKVRVYDATDRFKRRLTTDRDYVVGPSERQGYFVVKGDLATPTDIFEIGPGPASRNGEMEQLYRSLQRR